MTPGQQAVEALEPRQLLSTSWFVSPSGSNQNPGTIAAPFQTIQAAANVAQPGDYVEIEAGTYHETVTPKNSGSSTAPIVYEAYNHESVTVSGADPITNWTTSNGDVYQAPMSWDLGEGNNEVFVDGQAINEARWPNTSLDLMNPTLATATTVSHSGNSYTIYNSSLNQAVNYWKGAIIHIVPGQAWVAETDTITGSAPGQITFTFASTKTYSSFTNPTAGNSFFLTNSFKALDSTAEWYRDPTSNTLYASMPAGDSPAGHDVEVKRRIYAFDLTNRSYTTIQGINIFAASIRTTPGSYSTVLNNIHAVYISQFLSLPTLWYSPANTGIQLNGGSSILENSTIAYSAGDGVIVTGSNSRVTNNLIHDVDYSASDSAAIRDYASGSEIDHNTIYNTGRDGILQEAAKIQVLYNTLHDIGVAVTEAGGIYTVGSNGQGSVIAYNTIYNMHSGGYGQKALFLDNYSSNYVVHDNNVYNVDVGIGLNFVSSNNKIYNNTFSASEFAVGCNTGSSWPGTSFTNNIFVGPTNFAPGAIVKNNVTTKGVATLGAISFSSGASSDIVDIPVGVPQPPAPPVSTPPASTTPVAVSPAPQTVAPIVAAAPVTVAALTTAVAADRAAIVADTDARKTALLQLAATVRADLAAWQAAIRQLRAARHKPTVSPSATVAPADVSALDAQVAQLLQQARADRSTLTADRRSDFTGIKSAHQKLAADLKSLAAARRPSHK